MQACRRFAFEWKYRVKFGQMLRLQFWQILGILELDRIIGNASKNGGIGRVGVKKHFLSCG